MEKIISNLKKRLKELEHQRNISSDNDEIWMAEIDAKIDLIEDLLCDFDKKK